MPDTGQGGTGGASRERDLFDKALREADDFHRSRGGSRREPSSSALPLPNEASFPGYDVIRFVHRGGQGAVFEAVHRASRRRVAIKVLLDGAFASEGERARFEREIDLLSRIRHPGIVAIHDSGDATGGSFHVMEFVEGVPFDAWARDPGHDLDERLRLFIRVCEAVNAAHLRGVIHRDLKPANILIDVDGNPHILDFGLAKDHGVLESGLTIAGQFVGSLPWASPEQVEGSASDIDMRSDVYALGILLHQLLTDEFPYPVTGRIQDVIRNITHAEPIRPNVIRARRGAVTVDADLEVIVARCLHKDRERRYQTAGELARELERLRAGAPIEARGDSGWYLLRKAMRRHRVAVGTVLAFIALLATSTATMAVLIREARDERDRANAAAARAEAGVNILHGLIENVDQMNEIQDVSAYLESAEKMIAEHWMDEPWAQARLRYAIGVAYEWTYVKNPRGAILGLARQIAAVDALELPATDEARRILFLMQLHRDTLTGSVFGPLSITADAARLADEAGSNPALTTSEVLGARVAYANNLVGTGRPAEAERVYRDAFETARRELGDEALPTTMCRQRMLYALAQAGECDQAAAEVNEWRATAKAKERTPPVDLEYRAALWTAVTIFGQCERDPGREQERDQVIAEQTEAVRVLCDQIEEELARIQKTARGRILAK